MSEKLNELETKLNRLEENINLLYERQIAMFLGMANPCPYCASTDLNLHYIQDSGASEIKYHVVCNNCKSAAGGYPLEHEAIKAWNQRSDHERRS